MGRPKDFPLLFGDLLVKYKSKAIAEREYKTYMLLAKEQKLDKDAKLSDIKTTDKVDVTATKVDATAAKHVSRDEPKVKKQRLVEPPTAVGGGGISSSDKVLYERLVEAERLRAEAEKQRGDDLSKIAMMLAGGTGTPKSLIIPPSTAAAGGEMPNSSAKKENTDKDSDEDADEDDKQNTHNTTTAQKRLQAKGSATKKGHF